MSSDPSQLAVNGGKPVREELLPSRKTFGEEEIQEAKEALESGSLFYAGGSKVYGFLDRARKLFGAEASLPAPQVRQPSMWRWVRLT